MPALGQISALSALLRVPSGMGLLLAPNDVLRSAISVKVGFLRALSLLLRLKGSFTARCSFDSAKETFGTLMDQPVKALPLSEHYDRVSATLLWGGVQVLN